MFLKINCIYALWAKEPYLIDILNPVNLGISKKINLNLAIIYSIQELYRKVHGMRTGQDMEWVIPMVTTVNFNKKNFPMENQGKKLKKYDFLLY